MRHKSKAGKTRNKYKKTEDTIEQDTNRCNLTKIEVNANTASKCQGNALKKLSREKTARKKIFCRIDKQYRQITIGT